MGEENLQSWSVTSIFISSALVGDRRSRLRSLERKPNIGHSSTSEEMSEASKISIRLHLLQLRGCRLEEGGGWVGGWVGGGGGPWWFQLNNNIHSGLLWCGWWMWACWPNGGEASSLYSSRPNTHSRLQCARRKIKLWVKIKLWRPDVANAAKINDKEMKEWMKEEKRAVKDVRVCQKHQHAVSTVATRGRQKLSGCVINHQTLSCLQVCFNYQ